MALPEQKTNEETMALITEAMKRGDHFVVTVGKRRSAAGMFETVAQLSDATAFQLSSPEPWLSQLLGGGEYKLQAYHADSPTVPIGSKLSFQVAGQNLNIPNARVVEQPEWLGPRVVNFLGGMPPAPAQSQIAAGWPGGPPLQPPSAVQVQAGYGAPVVQAQQIPSQDAQSRAWLEQRERDLAAREAKLARESAEKEADIKRAESEHRLREEGARANRELEQKLAALSKPSDTSWVKDLVAALAPIAVTVLQQNASRQEMMLKLQLDAQERADRRAAEDRAASDRRLEAMSARPAMSDEMKLLIETLRGSASSNGEILKSQLDAMSMVTKNSVAMIEVISNLKLGDEPEHPLLLAAREGVAALRALTTPQPGQRRQPPQQPPQLPYSAAATAPVPQAPPQAQPQQGNGAVATAPQQGFAGLPPTQAQPQQPQLTVEQQTVLARRTIQAGQRPGDNDDPLVTLELAIKAHHSPAEVAAYFFASYPHPKVLAALREAGGEVDDLLKARLGFWLTDPANIGYISQLGRTIDQMGAQLGLFEPEDEDDDDSDDAADGPAAAVIDSVAVPTA